MIYISVLVILFVSFLSIGFLKADLHMKYLKEIKPSDYSIYQSHLSAFSVDKWNIMIQFFIIPFFLRERELENDKAKILARRIKLLITYQLILLLSIILIVLYIVMVYGE